MNDELLLTVNVTCLEAITVEGAYRTVVMIPFTGEADGPYFTGKVIGPGVDTQKIDKGKAPHLSARYMLEGKDANGYACRVFIENQGNDEIGLTPKIVTDSPLLARWENEDLYATAEGTPGGVIISIYRRIEIA